ncbi:hypothetical protein Tco_0583215 [Tanacetum coccineum]
MLTKPQVFYDNNLKLALGFQNYFNLKKAQQIRPMLYDGSVIAKETNVISIADSKETLMLEDNGLKKLKYHLGQFDTVVKKQITLDALTEGEWGFEHTKAIFLKEIIPFLKTLEDIFNVFDKDLLNECFEIQKKQFLIENDRLLDQIISQDIVNIVLNCSVDMNTSVNVNSFVAMNDSVNYVEKKRFRKLKGKDKDDNAAQVLNTTFIAPGMYKLDQVTLAHMDTNNWETQYDYNKADMEQLLFFRVFVEQAKSLTLWIVIFTLLVRNIMDEVDIEDLTIEQYFSLTQENQTPKKIKDMTITEYMEYEKKMNKNHISNTKTYLLTYFSKSTPTHDPIREFAHYFVPNQPGAESNCDSEDMEEEVEYMTDDEVDISEQEESNHGNTQNIQHFEEKDDVDKWLNAKITKHMSMQGVENTEDALINIIKSIKKDMKGDIMKKQIEASIANIGNETFFIASNEVDTDDDNTSPIASCLLPKELSPGSFLLPFNIDGHSLYAITTLEAKDNIMPLDVYKYLGLDKLRDAGTIENTT